LYEEEIYASASEEAALRQLVCFAVAEEWYAIDMHAVVEVILVTRITAVPNVPAHILGIANVRGNIVSVTDLKSILGLGADRGSERRRVIVIRHDDIVTGLAVDGDEEAVTIPIARVEPLAPTLGADAEGLLEGQFIRDGKMIAIFSVEKLIRRTKLTG
jgi:purine-binding chemotaxis protein CheW